MLYNTTFKIPKKFAVSMHYKLYIYLDPFTNMSRLCHICSTSKLEISIVLYITVKPIFLLPAWLQTQKYPIKTTAR